eukprot:1682854-Ditylum_brightwellii.AAC.1
MKLTIGASTRLQTIQRKNPTELLQQLGLLNNPMGDTMEKLAKCMKCSKNVAKQIWKTFVSPMNAYRLYQNVWLPACQYPLAVM